MTTSTFDIFIRDLRSFEDRKVLLSELRKEIRKPVPKIRKNIRKWAVEILPSGGGLGKWVSGSRITAELKFSGRAAGIRLKARRKSLKGESDLSAINRGRVLAPSWGRRSKNDWHLQMVTPGWFTVPADDQKEWRDAILSALDNALKVIRG